MNTKTCEYCNKLYEVDSNHSYSKYCSNNCRTSRYKEVNTKEWICKNCGEKIYSYNKKSYCGKNCLSEHYKSLKPKRIIEKEIYKNKCLNCHTRFETTNKSKKYCGDKCSYEYRYSQSVSLKIVFNKKCVQCGNEFKTTDKRKKYCSSNCKDKHDNKSNELNRRRNVRKNGKVNYDITLSKLVDKYNGVCYLCSEMVNVDVHSNHDDYPSIEHVKPIAKGGTHTWDNVKLAHRKCNYLKGIST